jgi:hypothetical protein
MAQSMLGMMYERGEGVRRDLEQAAKWYRKAAEQGDVIAQVNLGAFYEQGRGVDQDLDEAEKWYRKAAAQGDPNAHVNLCRFIEIAESKKGEFDDEGRLTITTELADIPLPDPELVGWCRAAAEQGNAEAQFTMGLYFAMGRLVPNFHAAADWFSLAAEQGHAEAQLRLGLAYILGLGVPQDPVQGYVWCRLSAESGNATAQGRVEVLQKMLTGKQLKRGDRRVAKWLEQSRRPS